MAYIQCSFFSKTLRIQTAMNVILPEKGSQRLNKSGDVPSGKFPVLWLYHGLSDDESSWMRNTSIERYAEEYGLAVVMPDAQRSYYNDMEEGGQYWQFISRELPRKARAFFPLSPRPRDSFVAGLSMGGFGAFKLALNQPGSVAAAGSFSGAVDILGRLAMQRGSQEEFRRIFGSPEQVEKSVNDLPWLVSRARGAAWPRLFQCCGTEDPFLEINRNFRNAARDRQVPLTYVEDAGYGHTWDYWDLKIQSFLEWLDGLDPVNGGNPGLTGNLSK
jgi:putative tributyrin esterase